MRSWQSLLCTVITLSAISLLSFAFHEKSWRGPLITSKLSSSIRPATSGPKLGGDSSPSIALTREAGANEKLLKLLRGHNCVEIPCIMFEKGEDAKVLPSSLSQHDIIAITSPQSAEVFIEAWIEAKQPPVKVVTVGKGTSKSLQDMGIISAFVPSDFNAETLAKELPLSLGNSVLYPTSALAENTLQRGLEERGFKVTRLNTYTTVPAKWTQENEDLARKADIVTFASPSAVKTWAERVGTDFVAVVIGPTSARAAEKAGFRRVLCPEGSKGVEAWAALVLEAVSTFAS